MHEEHDNAERPNHERLTAELRCLLRDVAVRVEEFLLELGRPEHAASREESAEGGGRDGTRENRCCPLCGALSLLRQHDGRTARADGVPEQLAGLLAALRDVARARGHERSGDEQAASSGREHAGSTAEPEPPGEEGVDSTADRVRPIAVRRVTGSVLGGDQT